MSYNFDEIIHRTGTDCVKYDLLDKLYGKADAMPFWVADMDFKIPPYVHEALFRKLDHQVFGYPLKSSQFFQSITAWLEKRHAWIIEPEWIVFSPGVVPSINLAIQAFTEPGDKIIVQPPVYFPFFSAVKHNQRELILNPLQLENKQYRIDFSDLEQKAAQGARMLIFCHPHNPVGRAWKPDELSELGRICTKYDLLILSDEIHADLMLHGRRHIPLASLGKDLANRTITCMAPSKTFNLAGLACSYLIIPEPALRSKFEECMERVHVGMGNTFGLAALEAAYKGGADWLGELLQYLEGNLEFMRNFFNEKFPQIPWHEPEATYLVWIDFRQLGLSPGDLMSFLVNKAGLALNAGETFGAGGEGFMRMNIACPRTVLMKGLGQLDNAIRSLRS